MSLERGVEPIAETYVARISGDTRRTEPGFFDVEELLTTEEEEQILAQVGEELLMNGDSDILPERADGFITEEQEAEILLEMADWTRTFFFGNSGRSPNG